MPIKSIIVDDEKYGRKNLAGILSKYCPEIEIVGEAESVKEATDLIRQLNPELIFLDIEMPEENGFKLFEYFDTFDFEVIFVTAYDSYAIKAIRFSAADYILKPINYIELQSAIKKVEERIQKKYENYRLKHLYDNIKQPQKAKIGLPTADRIEFVKVDEIVRCKSEGSYTNFYLSNKKHILVSKNIGEFQDLLTEYSFIRIHKTHLVNLNHVTAFLKSEGGIIQLSDGSEIPVSRRRKDSVLNHLKEFQRLRF